MVESPSRAPKNNGGDFGGGEVAARTPGAFCSHVWLFVALFVIVTASARVVLGSASDRDAASLSAPPPSATTHRDPAIDSRRPPERSARPPPAPSPPTPAAPPRPPPSPRPPQLPSPATPITVAEALNARYRNGRPSSDL
eukprot:2451192-Prymnesium_polylepis.1